MNLFAEITTAYALREINKEALRDFQGDFDRLTDRISQGFKLDASIYNNASRREHGVNSSLDDVATYLLPASDRGYLLRNGSTIDEAISESIDSGKFRGVFQQLGIGPIALGKYELKRGLLDIDERLDRKQMLGMLTLQTAKSKALLREDGIRSYYGGARRQAEARIELYEKAAEILFNSTDERAKYRLETLLEEASKGSGVKTKQIVGAVGLSFALVGCALGVPTENKPNFDPNLSTQVPSARTEIAHPETPIPTLDLISEVGAVSQDLSTNETNNLIETIQTKLLRYDEEGKKLVSNENEAVCSSIEKYLVGGSDEITLCKTLINGEEMVVGVTEAGTAVELLPVVLGDVKVYGVWTKDNKIVTSDTVGSVFVPFIGRGADGKDYIYSETSQQYHRIEGVSEMLNGLGVDEILISNTGGTLVEPQTIRFDNGHEFMLTPQGDWVEVTRGPSPEQIAANMAEWNAEFTDKERTWYQVTTDGRFVAVNKDGSTQDVPNFRYDQKLNVLWQLKPSVYLNKDIWVPITTGDTRPERKQDANGNTVLTGNINFPACAFDRSTLACRAETVWMGGEKVEQISKAEAMLTSWTWMEEIYQRTLANEGQAAADALLEEDSPIRALTEGHMDEYMVMSWSGNVPAVTMYDGTVWTIYNGDGFRHIGNGIYLTDENGKFVREIPVQYMVSVEDENRTSGVAVVRDPDGNVHKLVMDQQRFTHFDYESTRMSNLKMDERLWEELTSIN